MRKLLVPSVLTVALLSIALLAPARAGHVPGHAGPPFAAATGPILVTVHPFEWQAFGGAEILNGLDVALLSQPGAPGPGSAGVSPDLPTVLFGNSVRLNAIELCYDADADAVLTQVLMRVDRNATGTTKTNPVAAALDTTSRTDEACRQYSVNHLLTPDDMAAMSINVDFATAEARFEIGRLTYIMEATTIAAPAP